MFRMLRSLFRALPLVLTGVFIIVMFWLFLVFPRVVNLLADLLGNMGTPLIAREQLIHTAIALVASLPPLWYFIIRPFREIRELADGQGLMVRQGQGIAYIDTESARHQIYKAVSSVGGIKHTEVSVDSRNGRAVVLLNLTTENSINGGRKKQEVRREVKKVLEDQLGVQLAGEPTINFRLAQIDADIPRPSEPVIAAPPPAPRPSTLPSPAPTPARSAPRPEPPVVVEPPATASYGGSSSSTSSTSPIVGRRQMVTDTTSTPTSVVTPVPAPTPVEDVIKYEDKVEAVEVDPPVPTDTDLLDSLSSIDLTEPSKTDDDDQGKD